MSEISQIIGIIDCYEALTNDDRPYRSAMRPYDALGIIKKDVIAGKFQKSIFEKFAYSLAGQNNGSGTKKEARV
jgi:HD-GYP domain-containing protein (c-di-GMP phosphodiesterase class II)